MNSTSLQSRRQDFHRRASAFVLGSLLLLSTTGCFRVSSDTALLRDAVVEEGRGSWEEKFEFSLRDAVVEEGRGSWEEKFEFSLGRLTFGLAQAGSKFVDLPPEARTMLNCMKGAEVSVHERLSGAPDSHSVLKTADKSMAKRGWERVVGVITEGQLVAVYIPSDCTTPASMRVALLVLDQQQLVCASARSDIGPLLALAQEKSKHLFPPRTETL